jgi:hypothetical protein
MRGVTMHLKMTAAGHVVNLNYGNYDKKTGIKGSLTKHFSLEILQKAPPKLWNSFVTSQQLFEGSGLRSASAIEERRIRNKIH